MRENDTLPPVITSAPQPYVPPETASRPEGAAPEPIQEPAILPGPRTETLPETDTSGGEVAQELGEGDAGIRPTTGGKFAASLKQLAEEVPAGIPFVDAEAPGAWVRALADRVFESELTSEKISAEEANKRYPGLPKPFTESVYPEMADLRASEAQRRKHLQDWIDRGPDTGLFFGLGVGAMSALDPINAAAGMTLGAAAKGLGLVATGAKGAALVFGENFVGNLAADIPSYYQRKTELQDVSVGETVGNAAAGAVFGTALNRIFHVAAKRFESAPKAVQEKMLREGITQHENGEKINLAGTTATQEIRRTGLVQPGGNQSSYEYRVLNHSSEAAHYRAIGADNEIVNFFPELGSTGIHAVDNAATANNHVGAPEGSPGKIQELHVDPNAKLVDLESPLPDPLISQAQAELSKAGVGDGLISKSQLEGMSARQVFELLRSLDAPEDGPQAMEVMGVRVQAEGFDGFRYVEKLGDQPTHNGVYLFDEKSTAPGEVMDANPDVVPQLAAEERVLREKLSDSPDSARDFSPETEKVVAEQSARAPIKQEEIDPLIEEQRKQAEAVLKSMAEDDASIEEAMAEMRRLDATDKQEANALSELITCATKGIV